MIVGVLTTCHTQYTSDSSIYFFYLIEQHFQFLLHTVQVLYMCTLCDSTNINTIIEFVPNCLQHVNGDGFNGRSDSYLQFPGYTRTLSLETVHHVTGRLQKVKPDLIIYYSYCRGWRRVAGFCANGNGTSVSTKVGKFGLV